MTAPNPDALKARIEAKRAAAGQPPTDQMSAPGRFAIKSAEREAPCADCGGTAVQHGWSWGTENRFFPGPARCDRCRERHEAETKTREAAQRAERERLIQQSERSRCLEGLAVPPLYADVTLEAFTLHGSAQDRETQGRALQLCRRYLATWPTVEPLVLLVGAPGTGKGHCVWSIAKTVAGTFGQRACVVKLADMIRDLRATWGRTDGPSEEKRLAVYRSPALLVVDEVSRHAFYGQKITQHLYDVLDWRLERLRPTILTTNEGDESLVEILGPALVDRIFGAGGVIDFGTASWRRHGQQVTQEKAGAA
jgi:DNA replication protein DnaC